VSLTPRLIESLIGQTVNDVTDDEDDEEAEPVKDGGDHMVRFFIINNVSRATSRTSDDEDDDDDACSSVDDSTDASTVDLIVEQVRQPVNQSVRFDHRCKNVLDGIFNERFLNKKR